MIICRTVPDHILSVASRLRERDREEFAAIFGTDDPQALAQAMLEAYGDLDGLLTGCLDNGPAVFVGGAVWTRPNVAAILFMATDDFPTIAKSATRFIRDEFLPQLDAEGFHRIEAVTLASYANMQRWLRLLGFRQEGVAEAYGANREDFHHFARVRVARPTCH